MRTGLVVVLGLSAGLALVAATRAVVAGGEDDASREAYRRDVRPLFESWCFKCHAGEKAEGDLDLAKLRPADDDDEAQDRWRLVRRMLRRGQMPPRKAPQPPAADVARALTWLDARLGSTATEAVDPGRVTLRRLSRFDYRCTIRDLLGIDFDAEARLPADDAGYGFDDIGDVMTLPPSLLEKYLAAAEEIAAKAIVAEDAGKPPVRRFDGDRLQAAGGVSRPKDWVGMYGAGEAFAEASFPREGEYLLRARAFGQQAGPDPARMELRIDGDRGQVVDVRAVQKAPEVYEVRARVRAGRHRVAAAFVNDYYKPDDPDPAQRDRNLYVQWIEVAGPVDTQTLPNFQRRLFEGTQGRPRDRALARDLVRRIADRAFRRPATDAEADRLAGVVAAAQKQGAPFERGLQLALTSVLVSPHFLFRVETDPAPEDPTAAHDLTDFELATRLSYFLWSSLPDEELTSLASRGALHDSATLAAQTKRMLADARTSSLAANFAAQWLELRRLDAAAPDPQRFPQFDEALRASMRTETEMFVDALLRENRPLREFLAADFTFVNERLARHYGLVGVRGERFQRVHVPDATRGGLLTQASILTLTSNPTRTSPVKRGKFVLEEILAEPPPPPPPGVGALDESDAAAKSASLRERLARHRTDPKCATCHTRMDALGFALENFDPVGAWRDRDGSQPVDATGTLADGRTFAGPAQLRDVLLADDSFDRCLAEKLMVYAVGRGPTRRDRDAVERLLRTLPGLDASFADVVQGIVQMDAFRRRRGERPPERK